MSADNDVAKLIVKEVIVRLRLLTDYTHHDILYLKKK